MIYAGTDFKKDNAWKFKLEKILRQKYVVKSVGFAKTALTLFFENGAVISIPMLEVKHLLNLPNGTEYLCLMIDYKYMRAIRV